MKIEDRLTDHITVLIEYDEFAAPVFHTFPDFDSAQEFVNSLASIMSDNPVVLYRRSLKPVSHPVLALNVLYDIEEKKLLMFSYREAVVVSDHASRFRPYFKTETPDHFPHSALAEDLIFPNGIQAWIRCLDWPVVNLIALFPCPLEYGISWVKDYLDHVIQNNFFYRASVDLKKWMFDDPDQYNSAEMAKQVKTVQTNFSKLNAFAHMQSWFLTNHGRESVSKIIEPYRRWTLEAFEYRDCTPTPDQVVPAQDTVVLDWLAEPAVEAVPAPAQNEETTNDF